MSEAQASHPAPSVYRRGDPLDIPLIDHHLSIHLLFPRLTSAIKWVLPKLHQDWTTGADGSISSGLVDGNVSEISRIKNPLLWKSLVEVVIHMLLLLGSSRVIEKHHQNGSLDSSISIQTPAMRNLGMFLRPSINHTRHASNMTTSKRRLHFDAIKTRLWLYSKIIALASATVIVPKLYEELKRRRERQHQMRLQEERQHSMYVYPSSRNATNDNNQYTTPRERQQATIHRRATDRKSRLQTLLSDLIIGTVDVFLPPLKLISYISYLWGMSPTPDLGMRLVGWDYASIAESSTEPSTDSGQQYHRHANFHYGNRRLLVEEALRTVSAIIPPRDVGGAIDLATTQTQNRDNSISLNADEIQTVPERHPARRGSWFRKRALSFIGVVEENNHKTNDDLRCNLNCSKCGVKNPTVPYMASCGHCYCYICLRMAITDDLYFQCLECGKPINSSGRVDFNDSCKQSNG